MKIVTKLLHVFSKKAPTKELSSELQQAINVGKEQMQVLKRKGLSIRVVLL